MGSFSVTIATSPVLRLWNDLYQDQPGWASVQSDAPFRELSYEEAEAEFDSAMVRLTGLLKRAGRYSNYEQARSCLDDAVCYANRMNEAYNGPSGTTFMSILRPKLLLDCLASAGFALPPEIQDQVGEQAT